MEPVCKAHVERMRDFLENLEHNPPKSHHELGLSGIAKLMCGIGFRGPILKPGAARGFAHDLLRSHSRLLNGQFALHVLHKKGEVITYKIFRERLLPYITEVLEQLEANDLIKEDDGNVPI